MNIKDYWMDVLRTSAIIGIVMSLSHVLEKYLLLFSNMTILGSSVVVLVESIISVCIFIGLVYYFTRRVAKGWSDSVEMGGQLFEVKFTYGRALSYILMSTMLAGVVVGVANTIYVDVVGYDLYVSKVVARLQEVGAVMAPYYRFSGQQPSVNEIIGEQIALVESQERPTMFVNIVSYMSSYMLYGGVVGLVVAAVARRKLNKQNDTEI